MISKITLLDVAFLRYIAENHNRPILIEELARISRQHRSSVTRRINKLIDAGLINRSGKFFNITEEAVKYME